MMRGPGLSAAWFALLAVVALAGSPRPVAGVPAPGAVTAPAPGSLTAPSAAPRSPVVVAAPAPLPAADTVPGIVEGRIWSRETADRLPAAVVELRRGSRTLSAVTDEDGRYRIDGVHPGEWSLRAFALDHDAFEVGVRVAGGSAVEVDLTLALHPISLTPITATVFGPPGSRESGGGSTGGLRPREREMREAELRALEANPGMGELGLAEAAGAPRPEPPDPASVLYVRGAAADLKLVLLDGAPVYAPFHLGGLMESFQPELFHSSRLYVGGAPARYDGGLSYVLDLRTRPGSAEGPRAAGSADLLGAGARVEGPIGDATLLVSGRAVHHGMPSTFLGDAGLPYGYGEALTRLDVPAGDAAHLSVTGFWNRESVQLDSATGFREPAEWGNAAGSVRFRSALGEGELAIGGAVSRFETALPVATDTPRVAEGSTRRIRLTADYTRPLGAATLGLGVSYDRHRLGFTAREVAEPETSATSARGEGQVLGVYAETVLRPAPELELRGGLRTDAFFPLAEARLAPRLSVAWKAAETATLTLAAGRFNQFVRTPETILSADLDGLPPGTDGTATAGEDQGFALDPELGVAGASHLVLGLENRLGAGLDLGLEAFFKDFDRLARTADHLRASGVDLWLSRSGGTWRGWLGYSMAWVWTDESLRADTDRFAGRHLLSGGLSTELRGGLEAGVRLGFGAGLSFTAIPIVDDLTSAPGSEGDPTLPATEEPEPPAEEPPLAGAPAGDYLRLDARLSRPWSTRLGGMDVELVPYLRLLNALDRRDALFYHFDPRDDLRPRELGAVPLLPVIGLEWRVR